MSIYHVMCRWWIIETYPMPRRIIKKGRTIEMEVYVGADSEIEARTYCKRILQNNEIECDIISISEPPK